jgi:hypothetical protein
VEIARVGANLDVGGSRHCRVAGALSAPGGVPARSGSVGEGLAAPGARDDIAGHVILTEEVERHHGKLERCPALDEKYLEVLGSPGKAAHQCLGVVVDLLVFVAAVAHLHDGHAGTVVFGKLVTDFFQDLPR